jgi:hypothetical protein
MSLVVGHVDAFDLDLDLLHHRSPATINSRMNDVVGLSVADSLRIGDGSDTSLGQERGPVQMLQRDDGRSEAASLTVHLHRDRSLRDDLSRPTLSQARSMSASLQQRLSKHKQSTQSATAAMIRTNPHFIRRSVLRQLHTS